MAKTYFNILIDHGSLFQESNGSIGGFQMIIFVRPGSSEKDSNLRASQSFPFYISKTTKTLSAVFSFRNISPILVLEVWNAVSGLLQIHLA